MATLRQTQSMVDGINAEWERLGESTEPFDLTGQSTDDEIELYLKCSAQMSRAHGIGDPSDVIYLVLSGEPPALVVEGDGKSPDEALARAVQNYRKGLAGE